MLVKILSLLLSVTLFFFAAVPARAAEVNHINVFDFAMPNGGDSFQVSLTPTNRDITFKLPSAFVTYYFDCTFYAYASAGLESVIGLSDGGTNFNLTLDKIANNVYRLHGNINGLIVQNFRIRFVASSNITVSFLSFHLMNFRETVFPETGRCLIRSQSFTDTINYNVADTVNRRVFDSTDDPGACQVVLDVEWDDWKLYDSLSFIIWFSGTNINSISALFGESYLDIEYNFIDASDLAKNQYYISCKVDLSNVDRRSSNIPTVHVEASNVPGQKCVVDVLDMAGHINSFDVNPVVYWLQKLNLDIDTRFGVVYTWLSTIWNTLSGNSTAADQFNDQADQKNEQLQDMVGVMDSVQRPDINKLDPVTQLNNSGADIAGGIGPVLTVPMQNPIILQVLILSLTFAMIAYVLYGKR